MANTTVALYIRGKAGYRKSPKKITDLEEGETYCLSWYEGRRKRMQNVGRFADAALVAQLNKRKELNTGETVVATVPVTVPAAKPVEYVRGAVADYLDGIHDRVGNSGYGASPRTEYAYRKRLSFLLEFDGITPMSEVDAKYFERYRRFLRGRLKSDRYVFNCLAAANIFFRSRGNESRRLLGGCR
jgi:hypothetical protein